MTLPGILTGAASLITAITSLYVILHREPEVSPEPHDGNEQQRREIIHRIEEIEVRLHELHQELGQLMPKKDTNPDLKHRIEEIERNIHDLDNEKRELQTRLDRLSEGTP